MAKAKFAKPVVETKANIKKPKKKKRSTETVAGVRVSLSPTDISEATVTKALEILRDPEASWAENHPMPNYQLILKLSKGTLFPSTQPYCLAVPHSMNALTESRVCVIVPDIHVRRYKLLLQETDYDGVTEILGAKQIEKEYNSYQRLAELALRFDLFIANKLLFPSLGLCLGSVFVKAGRVPVAVELGDPKDEDICISPLIDVVRKLKNSVFLKLPRNGRDACCTLGSCEQPVQEIVENVMTVIRDGTNALLEGREIDGKYPTVKIAIRATQGPTLPLWLHEKCIA